MGACSPLPRAAADLGGQVRAQGAQPTVDEMRRRGTPFVGVVYCGLALTSKGPRVIEFNARFGDPEIQVVLARLRTPLAGILHAAATGRLAEAPALEWHDKCAVNVVIASEGYPTESSGRREINGLDAVANELAVVLHVLQAVTFVVDPDITYVNADALLCDGGPVLSVVSVGETVAAAREAAYSRVDLIGLDGAQ